MEEKWKPGDSSRRATAALWYSNSQVRRRTQTRADAHRRACADAEASLAHLPPGGVSASPLHATAGDRRAVPPRRARRNDREKSSTHETLVGLSSRPERRRSGAASAAPLVTFPKTGNSVPPERVWPRPVAGPPRVK
ncbi:unnamed protein product, partial [Iphiclides podalirius]